MQRKLTALHPKVSESFPLHSLQRNSVSCDLPIVHLFYPIRLFFLNVCTCYEGRHTSDLPCPHSRPCLPAGSRESSRFQVFWIARSGLAMTMRMAIRTVFSIDSISTQRNRKGKNTGFRTLWRRGVQEMTNEAYVAVTGFEAQHRMRAFYEPVPVRV